MPTHHCMRLRALLCLRPQLPLPPCFIEKRSPNPSLRAGCKTYARVAGSPSHCSCTSYSVHRLRGFFFLWFFFGHNHTLASLSQRGVPSVSLSGRWFLGSTWEPRVTWGVLCLASPATKRPILYEVHYLRGFSPPFIVRRPRSAK